MRPSRKDASERFAVDKDKISARAWIDVRKLVKRACETISREYAFLAQGVEVPNTKRMEAVLRKARGEQRRGAK